MYEIIIIICLAIALYLLLRHYPAASNGITFNSAKFRELVARFPKFKYRKKLTESEVREIVETQNQMIVAPAITEEAGASYREPDEELAKKLFQADEAFAANDLRLAEDLSLEVIGANKKSAFAYVIYGKVSYSRGQFEEAREAFKVALKCDKEIGEAYYWLGLIELRDENMSPAIESLQKCIALEKGHPEWYAELGKAYMEVRQYAKAAKALKRAASLDIDNKEYRDLATEAEEKQKTHSFYTRMK